MATAESKSTRAAELLGLVAFAIALMLLIALATFDPRDPAPFFKAGVERPARNFIGPFGAFLAELLIPQLFGISALLLPLVLGLIGWKLFWCRPIDAPYTKAVGNTMLLLSSGRLPRPRARHGELRGRAGPRRRRPRRPRGRAADRRLQPHRRLHRRRHGAVRRPHPLDPVLVRSLPARRRRAGRRPLARDPHGLGPLPREPPQGTDAARGGPQARAVPRARDRGGEPGASRGSASRTRTTTSRTRTSRHRPSCPAAHAADGRRAAEPEGEPSAEAAAVRDAGRRTA